MAAPAAHARIGRKGRAHTSRLDRHKASPLTKPRGALNYRAGALANCGAREHAMTDVTVSARAARRIGEILKGEPAGAMLRVSVEGGGCSGFQYKFDIEHSKAEDDLEIARDGAVVLIDPMSLQFLAGAE